MGRYYRGDIEGKFWFAVQSSDDASFFGGEVLEPSYLEYYFDKETHWDSVVEGVQKCEKELGEWKEKLDGFFKKHDSYNEQILMDEIGLKIGDSSKVLEWYARLLLGQKIKDCLEGNDQCCFEAEL